MFGWFKKTKKIPEGYVYCSQCGEAYLDDKWCHKVHGKVCIGCHDGVPLTPEEQDIKDERNIY